MRDLWILLGSLGGFIILPNSGISGFFSSIKIIGDTDPKDSGSSPLVSPSPSFKLQEFPSCEGIECRINML